MSFNEIDDTLVAYFKQMLDEESAHSDETSKEGLTETEKELSALQQDVTPIENDENTENQSLSAGDDIDYAADDYEPPVAEQPEVYVPELQTQSVAQEENSSLPFVEHKSLQSLLENVNDEVTKTDTNTVTEIADPVTEVKTEVAGPVLKRRLKLSKL